MRSGQVPAQMCLPAALISAEPLTLLTFPGCELPWSFCSSCSIVTWQEVKSFLGRTAKRDRLPCWNHLSAFSRCPAISWEASKEGKGLGTGCVNRRSGCHLRRWPSSFSWRVFGGADIPRQTLPFQSRQTSCMWIFCVKEHALFCMCGHSAELHACRAAPATQPRGEGTEPRCPVCQVI